MSQRSLFVILVAVLFAACEDDTLVSLNAVTFTRSHLSAVAESARHAAGQTDILAARVAVFTDSAIAFSDSAIAFSDSARVADVLLAAADHDFRLAQATASSFFSHNKDKSKVIEEAAVAYKSNLYYLASKAYEEARRTSFAAYVAAAAAYDARHARLASKAYKVARRTADETAAISRRVAAQAAAAQATQAAARQAARRAAAVVDSLQAASKAATQAASDKAARLRRAYDKDAAAQAAARQAATAADSLQAASKAAQTATAARRAASKATEAAKVYAAEVTRLRRAYNRDAVQAAYDVATAAAYATAYEVYRNGACLAAGYAADQALFGTAYADTNTYGAYGPFSHIVHAKCGIPFYGSSSKDKAAIQAARTAYVTYVDSTAYATAYDAAHALFNAAYAPDSSDPQAAAAEAYAAASRGKNKAVRDSAYVIPPISTATAALATTKAAYLACATHVDSILNSIE